MGTAHSLIQLVLEKLRENHWSNSDLFSIEIALEEAFANAVHHGNKNRPEKNVHFLGALSEKTLRVKIEDEGEGFNPGEVEDPRTPENIERISGRGVLLIYSFMNRVDYSENGRCILMEKDRDVNDPSQ